jgi:hypothetical protein
MAQIVAEEKIEGFKELQQESAWATARVAVGG